MAKFICNECGYRFDATKIKECPYCGKEEIEKEKSAEELIDNVRFE